jgi:uncharacterized protein (DUF1778 family)
MPYIMAVFPWRERAAVLADQTDFSVHGTKTARMEQRTTLEAKELIEKAASLLGINASEFTVAAAVRAARETVKEYQMTALKRDSHAAFLKAWDATEPTDSLVGLMKLRQEVAASE